MKSAKNTCGYHKADIFETARKGFRDFKSASMCDICSVLGYLEHYRTFDNKDMVVALEKKLNRLLKNR